MEEVRVGVSEQVWGGYASRKAASPPQMAGKGWELESRSAVPGWGWGLKHLFDEARLVVRAVGVRLQRGGARERVGMGTEGRAPV